MADIEQAPDQLLHLVGRLAVAARNLRRPLGRLRCVARKLRHSFADLGKRARDLRDPFRGLTDIACNQPRRMGLLSYRSGDPVGGLVHLTEQAGDFLDHLDRLTGLSLNLLNAPLDILGRAARLIGQFLDLACDHGKPLARVARGRRFDRGIERKQIGLQGDALDRIGDLGDVLGRLA